jgi:hypothetical protein
MGNKKSFDDGGEIHRPGVVKVNDGLFPLMPYLSSMIG